MGTDHAFDQEILFTDEDKDLLEQVGDLVYNAKQEDDRAFAWGAGRRLRRTIQVGGVALAKFLFLMREQFYPTDPQTFEDDAYSEIGAAPQTARKYTDVYEHVLIPHPELASKPIGGLILLIAAAKEGDLTPSDWEAIRNAPDIASIRDIVRKARGTATSSETALRIFITRDGILKARRGEGEYVEFGSMAPRHEKEEAVAARERILRTAGVIEL